MTPRLRKLALTAHIAFSVGLPGSIAAFLALAVAGLTSQDPQIVRAVYPAMDSIARFVIIPLAFASLLTGLIQSLGTPWGLFRHYWILVKLLLIAFATTILLIKMELVRYAAGLAAATILSRADLRAAGIELAVHAAAGLLVLLVPVALSVYKPWGLTPYGRRKPSQRPSPDSSHATGVTLLGESITITLRRTHVYGIAAVVLTLHFLLFAHVHAQHKPYASQQAREIKALSDEEVSQYLAGAGMGFAKSAELNRYPGPMHVLELADPLKLTAEQRTATKALMDAHKTEARAIGAKLVESERALERLFREGGVDAAKLADSVAATARLQGEYRLSHLETHRRMRALLSDEQVARYDALRGYGEHRGH